MKPIVVSLLFVLLLSGCKKAIEQKKQDLVIQAMTNGQWMITNFVRNGNTITDDFNGYKFQYYSNKTVDAIKIGLVEKSGTIDSMTRSCSRGGFSFFPAGARAPCQKSLIDCPWSCQVQSWPGPGRSEITPRVSVAAAS